MDWTMGGGRGRQEVEVRTQVSRVTKAPQLSRQGRVSAEDMSFKMYEVFLRQAACR